MGFRQKMELALGALEEPLPERPPAPTAMRDCMTLYPAPRGLWRGSGRRASSVSGTP
jgi:hypothetical protein